MGQKWGKSPGKAEQKRRKVLEQKQSKKNNRMK